MPLHLRCNWDAIKSLYCDGGDDEVVIRMLVKLIALLKTAGLWCEWKLNFIIAIFKELLQSTRDLILLKWPFNSRRSAFAKISATTLNRFSRGFYGKFILISCKRLMELHKSLECSVKINYCQYFFQKIKKIINHSDKEEHSFQLILLF